MARTSYVIALGSNRRSRHGSPAQTVRAAAELLEGQTVSRTRATPAFGPAGRSFANAALVLQSERSPPDLLAALKRIEAQFGRRAGRRWGARVIDLDIILWSGGAWSDDRLTVPHRDFRTRPFVLEPVADIAADWRDPLTGLTVRQLLARSRRARPVDPRSPRP